MKIATTVLTIATAFIFGSAAAQTTTNTTTQTKETPTVVQTQGSVWIKDTTQSKEYLKSIGAEDKMKKPEATTPTMYQKNGSVWCKNGTVVDREQGVICAGDPKK